MKLAEILDTLESLDRAYETVEEELSAARGGLSVPSWESIVRMRPRREPGVAAGELRCAAHGGAPHGLAHDGLSDHLASELSEWTRFAEHSGTVRMALGIERMDPEAGGRIAAMLHVDGDLELHARFAASGGAVTPTEAGRWLWVHEDPQHVDFRPRSAANESYLLFSNDGKGRRWSFSEIRKGYEDYLTAAGRRPDDAALDKLRTCPCPKLLGSLTDYNRRNPAERAPIAMSEAWLWDGGAGEAAGDLATPCEACKFALSAWMCGHSDMLARSAAANFDYAKKSREWLDRLRDRKPPRKVRAAAGLDSDAPPPAKSATDTLESGDDLSGNKPVSSRAQSSGRGAVAAGAVTAAGAASAAAVAVAGAGAVAGTAAGAAALGARPVRATGAVETPMVDLPESDVTGRSRYRRYGDIESQARPGAAASALEAKRRERVRVRLESSDFPCDNVEVRELHGKEAISTLFSFHVDIVCFDADGLDTAKMLGAGASLVFEQGDLETRRVYGMVAEVIDHLETESEWRSYRLWIVPRVWRSTLVETQEVYLDTNVPDLLQQKLSLVGLSGADVEMRLFGSYPVRDMIVQYKETDVAFLSRLAEHLGIFFFFEHDGGADKIVFSDKNAGFRSLANAASLPFRPRGEGVDVFALHARSRAFPASYAMQDYNYRTPRVDLTKVFEAAEGFGGGVVEYGAHYKTPAEGAALAQVRAEERVVENQTYEGKSDRAELSPGGTFTLTGHSRMEGAEFLVVEIEHHVRQTVKMQGAASGDEPYRNTFRAVSASLQYRPPRATPRPRIHGVLTALVEPNADGEVGEQANIDPEGRYTVKFYFDAGDLAGRAKNSRLVRMIQPHSGTSYGHHFPLKPGVEVLIVFMDGDPDRPLIMGSVHNPVTPSPVGQEVALMNRIETASGLIIEMRDAVPPLAK